jgi:coenzyme F420-reducing hydrogenase beta subunit
MGIFLHTLEKKECYGCGACMNKCPCGAITMDKDRNGFPYPFIDRKMCSDCGTCDEICPFSDSVPEQYKGGISPDVYLVQHRDAGILKKSTSGGAFAAIAETFCDRDYVIFGAAFNRNLEIRHDFITDIRQLEKFHGSKYVQSNTGFCYRKAGTFLKQGRKVLFAGTPCQIAGLRSYLCRDYRNLLCIDLVCHGVPGPFLLKKYIKYMENKAGMKVKFMAFRDKNKYGWLAPCTRTDFADSKNSYYCQSADDPYEKVFLGNIALRECCYDCRFAGAGRVGDLTIGDFWGADILYPGINNKKGLSLLIINNVKGKCVFENIGCFSVKIKSDMHSASLKNKTLTGPAARHKQYSSFDEDLHKMKFDLLVGKYFSSRPFYIRLLTAVLSPGIKRKIKNMLTFIRHQGN